MLGKSLVVMLVWRVGKQGPYKYTYIDLAPEWRREGDAAAQLLYCYYFYFLSFYCYFHLHFYYYYYNYNCLYYYYYCYY